MSETPRTDAASQIIPVPDAGKFERCIKEVVMADFARQLERELAAMEKLNRIHVEELNRRDAAHSQTSPKGESQ